MGIKLDSNLSKRDRAIALNNANKICAWLGGKKEAVEIEVGNKRASRRPTDEPTEHDHQVIVVKWWAITCPLYSLPRLALFAIPNANMLLPKAAHPERLMAYMTAEGFRKGASDMFLAVPVHPFGGMFIEMKRNQRSVATDEQVHFIAEMNRLGYKAIFAKGSEHAIQEIKQYLSPRHKQQARLAI